MNRGSVFMGLFVWGTGLFVGMLVCAALSSPIWLPMLRNSVKTELTGTNVQLISWDGRVLPNRVDTLLFLGTADVVVTLTASVDNPIPIPATLEYVSWTLDINQRQDIAHGRTPETGSLDSAIRASGHSDLTVTLTTPAAPLTPYIDNVLRALPTMYVLRGEISILVLGYHAHIDFETPPRPIQL